MRIKTRAPKRIRLEFLRQKRERKMESSQDRGVHVCLNEREVLLTFHDHLHLSGGRYWTENVWEQMARYYEGLAKSPATVASLKLAFDKYSLEHNLITSLHNFGINFDQRLNMLVGCDSCWDAAEVKMSDYKELIQNMKRRLVYNFHLLRDVFSYFAKNASSHDHEQRIAHLEKEVGEIKTRQEAANRRTRKFQRTTSKRLKRLIYISKKRLISKEGKDMDMEEGDSDE